MREIKFRAWLKELDEMVEHSEIIAPFIIEPTDSVGGRLKFQKLFRYYSSSGHHSWENELCEDVILMQYTGFKDKTGKEIYEGDKCKKDGHSEPYEIVFYKGAWTIKSEDSKAIWHQEFCNGARASELTVIGNIYEPSQKNEAKPLL